MLSVVQRDTIISEENQWLTGMEFGPQQIGKWLVLFGAVIVTAGVALMVLGKMGLFKLPGDFLFGSKNWPLRGWRIYLPLGSCILISVILTLLFWLIRYLRS